MRRIDRKKRHETEPPGLKEKRRPGNTEQPEEGILKETKIRSCFLSHRRTTVAEFMFGHLWAFFLSHRRATVSPAGIPGFNGSCGSRRLRHHVTGCTTNRTVTGSGASDGACMLGELCREIKNQIKEIERKPGFQRPVRAQPAQLEACDAFPTEEAEGEQAP